MSYTSFLLKKIYKNKFNIIPFILFMGFIIFVYGVNRTQTYKMLFEQTSSDKQSISYYEAKIFEYENLANNVNSSEDEREMAQKLLVLYNTELLNTEKMIDAVSKEDWPEYYKGDKAKREAEVERYQIKSDHSAELTKMLIRTNSVSIKYNQHMLEYGKGFDSMFNTIQGVSFNTYIYAFFIALFISVIMIFITSKIYCSTNIDRMDIQTLLPISQFKRQRSKMYTGICVGVGTLIFFSIIGFLCGTIGNTTGNLHSPIVMYTSEGMDSIIPFIEILPKFIILLILTVLFISNVVLCISLYFRKGMICMLISLVVILGGLFVVPKIIPLSQYLHFIPTTYINFFNVLTGRAAFDVQNLGVNFLNGALVLMISNIVLIVAYYFITKSRIKRVR